MENDKDQTDGSPHSRLTSGILNPPVNIARRTGCSPFAPKRTSLIIIADEKLYLLVTAKDRYEATNDNALTARYQGLPDQGTARRARGP